MAADQPSAEEPTGDLLDRAAAEALARTLRAVADPTRLQVLSLIRHSATGRLTGGQLAERLALTQPTLSHHLGLMVEDGLLVRERQGKYVWFSVASDRLTAIDDLLG